MRVKTAVSMPTAEEKKEQKAAKLAEIEEEKEIAKELYLERGRTLKLEVEKFKEDRLAKDFARQKE